MGQVTTCLQSDLTIQHSAILAELTTVCVKILYVGLCSGATGMVTSVFSPHSLSGDRCVKVPTACLVTSVLKSPQPVW